jgi:hypothetical protein
MQDEKHLDAAPSPPEDGMDFDFYFKLIFVYLNIFLKQFHGLVTNPQF